MYALAQAGQNIINKATGLWLLVFILLITILGIAVIVMLTSSWRRYNKRLNRPKADRQELPDVWRTSADRLKDEDENDQEESSGDQPQPPRHP